MGGFHWLGENWFTALNAAGVVGSILFTGLSFRAEIKSRQISNLIAITANHREIWMEFLSRPELRRVLDATVDLKTTVPTPNESEFVNLAILHLSCVYQTMQSELVLKDGGVRRDVCEFFSLPIPSQVWEKAKVFHDDDFVAFVEACRNWK